MKKYFLVSILLLLGTMLGTATAQIITGKVTDPSRQPIDGAYGRASNTRFHICRSYHYKC